MTRGMAGRGEAWPGKAGQGGQGEALGSTDDPT